MIKPWLASKTLEAKKLNKSRVARAAQRWGGPAGVALIIFLFISSFFIPKDDFQQAKQKLLKNPNYFEAQITIAEKFLENNQFENAEKALLLAQKQFGNPVSQVLGEQTNPQLKELWQKKIYSDSKEIEKLISLWKKIIEEKPNYRDGYLQLVYLHYKIYENEKAKEYLQKAIELDPNYSITKEMEKLLNN